MEEFKKGYQPPLDKILPAMEAAGLHQVPVRDMEMLNFIFQVLAPWETDGNETARAPTVKMTRTKVIARCFFFINSSFLYALFSFAIRALRVLDLES